MMSVEDFEDRLDHLGGTLERWPGEIRREAEVLLATSSAARALLADMARVEACLRAPVAATNLGGEGAGASFERMAGVATRHRQVRRSAPAVRRAGWGTGLAAALALGVLVGSVQVDRHVDSPDEVLATALDTTGPVDVD